MRLALAVVAAIALACLLARSARLGLAGDYADSVSRAAAPDQALCAGTSTHMEREGGWERFAHGYANGD